MVSPTFVYKVSFTAHTETSPRNIHDFFVLHLNYPENKLYEQKFCYCYVHGFNTG